MNRWFWLVLPALSWITFCFFPVGLANGQSMSLDVPFGAEVAPILAKKCLRCHGPDKAEGDFRIDEASSFEDYVEPGDPDMSELYAMVSSTEEDYRMPPELGDHLDAGELGTIEGWIIQGGKYQEVEDWEAKIYEGTDLAKTDTLAGAVWVLYGRFHPALVHFPIALLTVAAFFAVFAFGNSHMEKAAIYCLVLGTMGSIAAAAAGWGFADYKGWPSYQTDLVSNNDQAKEQKQEQADDSNSESLPDDVDEPTATAESQNDPSAGRRVLSEEEREKLGGKVVDPAKNMWDVSNFIFFDGTDRSMHRWGGVGVCLLAMVVTALGMYVRRDPDNSLLVWKLSTVVLAAMVGWVGHQGGEIHHGDLYKRPLERIQQILNQKNEVTTDASDEDSSNLPDGVVDPNINADESEPNDVEDDPKESAGDDADQADDDAGDDSKSSAEVTLDSEENGTETKEDGDDE